MPVVLFLQLLYDSGILSSFISSCWLTICDVWKLLWAIGAAVLLITVHVWEIFLGTSRDGAVMFEISLGEPCPGGE